MGIAYRKVSSTVRDVVLHRMAMTADENEEPLFFFVIVFQGPLYLNDKKRHIFGHGESFGLIYPNCLVCRCQKILYRSQVPRAQVDVFRLLETVKKPKDIHLSIV